MCLHQISNNHIMVCINLFNVVKLETHLSLNCVSYLETGSPNSSLKPKCGHGSFHTFYHCFKIDIN